jgi:hypothetical protein
MVSSKRTGCTTITFTPTGGVLPPDCTGATSREGIKTFLITMSIVTITATMRRVLRIRIILRESVYE